jgi:hypothetical protein
VALRNLGGAGATPFSDSPLVCALDSNAPLLAQRPRVRLSRIFGAVPWLCAPYLMKLAQHVRGHRGHQSRAEGLRTSASDLRYSSPRRLAHLHTCKRMTTAGPFSARAAVPRRTAWADFRAGAQAVNADAKSGIVAFCAIHRQFISAHTSEPGGETRAGRPPAPGTRPLTSA